MTKAIIFDITGVLFPFQPWVGERPAIEDLKKIKRIASEIYEHKKISKEYLKEKIFQADRPREELEAIYKSLTVIDEPLFELIKKLSKTFDLYCLANEAKYWTDIRKDLYGFEKYFKRLFISIEIGKRKPDEDIFEFFLSETGLKPAECLFVDDKQINVDVAQKLGFQGYVYHYFEGFQRFIEESNK